MRKIILYSLSVVFAMLMFFGVAVGANLSAKAASVTYTGVFQKSTNSAYDHTLSGVNINLIVGTKYDAMLGHTVNVNVSYTSGGHFVVNSITDTTGTITSTTTTTTNTTATATTSGDVRTYTGIYRATTTAPYDHTLEGKNLNFIVGKTYDSLLGRNVKVTVTYSASGHFTVNSIVDASTSTTTTTSSTTTSTTAAGTVKIFTGVLIDNPNSAYQFLLQGTNINLILGSSYDSWLNKTVQVKVTYGSNGHFTINSVVKVS